MPNRMEDERMKYEELFHSLYPGFFQEKGIAAMPRDWVFTELVMNLREEPSKGTQRCHPEGITFGEYHGELEALREAVRQVDEEWVRYFREGYRCYGAFDGERIVAFCHLGDLGTLQGLRIGGPGCVGTIPAYRRRGIGLEMVRLATEALRQEGFDLSWIHYTHLAHWYERLGYQPVLRWNSGGILQSESIDGR